MTRKEQIKYLQIARDHCYEYGLIKCSQVIKKTIAELERIDKLQELFDTFIAAVEEISPND